MEVIVMSLAEVLPMVQTLPRADKLRLVHFLVSELAREEGITLLELDWRSIQETLYLLSIPGMRESIQEGLQTPLQECSEEVEW
jgi:hypothetical protein